MGFITDKVPVKNGADYTFVCSRIPFAVSCSSILPHGEYNLIDLDLVLKLKIPLQRIRVERYSIMGETMRAVGYVSQTVQCVRQGRVSGTIHIQAKVIRDLYSLYDVDCIASTKTYSRLVGKEPAKPPDDLNLDLADDEGDNTALADDGGDKIALADDGGDKIALVDDEEDKIEKEKNRTVVKKTRTSQATVKEKDTPKDDNEDEGDNVLDDEQEDLPIGDIPWQFGYTDVPTADEDYNPDYIIGARVPPHTNTSGNKMSKPKSKICTKKNDEEMFCKICFADGEPLTVVTSHHNLDITCPTMTDEEKETLYGPNWIPKMFGYT